MNSPLPDLPLGLLPRGEREPKRVPAPPQSIRLPDELRAHLRLCAEANCRSLNAEIVFRLQASMVGESIDEHGVIVRRVASINK